MVEVLTNHTAPVLHMAVVLQEQLIKEAMVATVHLMQTKALEAAVAAGG